MKTEKKALNVTEKTGNTLIKLCKLENAENRRKAFDNVNKGIDEIEAYNNTHFLNLINFVKK